MTTATVSIALSLIPAELKNITIFITIDDTLQVKYGDKFDCYYKLFDHSRYHRDILFEIITDELKHSGKYNYIYTKNMSTGKNNMSKNCRGNCSRTAAKNYTLDEWEKIIDPLVQKADYESYDS